MAGIGFTLQKLSQRDDLLGVMQAFLHAAVVAAGPWIVTVIALSAMYLVGARFVDIEALGQFRVIVSYNICFSLVFSSPIFMVITRYIADHVHVRDVRHVTSVYVGGWCVLCLTQMPVVLFFYGWLCDGMSPVLRLQASIHYMLIATIWLATVLITSLQGYKMVSLFFVGGMSIALLGVPLFGSSFGVTGMFAGFNAGLVIVAFGLSAQIFHQYGYRHSNAFLHWLPFVRKYWLLALNGFLYNAAIWVDKWVMWVAAPEQEVNEFGMHFYSHYDSSMFLAYLVVIPSLALFVFNMETSFFRYYSKFYKDLLGHVSLERIVENQQSIVKCLGFHSRNFLMVQGGISCMVLLLSAKFFEWFGLNFIQLGMFRLGLVGAFFHIMFSFLLIVMAYFDDRRGSFWFSFVFLGANALFTALSVRAGFLYYGMGYVMASILCFALAAVYVFDYLRDLPYRVFVANNPSVPR